MAKENLTIDGIKLRINPVALSDWDVYQLMTKTMRIQAQANEEDRSLTPQETIEQADLVSQLVEKVFGNDFANIKAQIRKKNDGYVPVSAIMSLLMKLVNEVGSKNS